MSKKKPETWFFGPGEAEYLSAHAGKPVALVLKTEEILEGILLGVDAYHLVLRRRDGLTVLVAKHAVAYMLGREAVEGASPSGEPNAASPAGEQR